MNRVKRIVFMGTPDFAVPCLEGLLKAGYEVVGVITAPDKPAGRGKKLQFSAVKECALAHKLNILQPTNLKNPEFVAELKSLQADLQVVVAFRMLPEVVWNMPPLGSVNLHGSLLPQYRGAAPIHWAVINGESETGVSTFLLQHEIDTGKIIFREKTPIGENETVGEVYHRLMHIGADLLVKTVDAINAGDYPQIEQDHIKDIKHAPKIFKEDCLVDWHKSAREVHNQIRGMSPFPGAFTYLDGQVFKLYRSEIASDPVKLSPGEIHINGKQMIVGCGEGNVSLLEIQLQGKRRMDVASFLNGIQLPSQQLG